MAIIKKKIINNKCWRGCREKGTLIHWWWECTLVEPLWETVWWFLRKLRIKLSYDPVIPLLGICQKKTWKHVLQRYMPPYVHGSTIHGGQDMDTTKVSFNRWLDKEDVVHIYYGTLLSLKKRLNTAICSNMVGPWEYYAKQNRSVIKS